LLCRVAGADSILAGKQKQKVVLDESPSPGVRPRDRKMWKNESVCRVLAKKNIKSFTENQREQERETAAQNAMYIAPLHDDGPVRHK
jgi:hypothetical protein